MTTRMRKRDLRMDNRPRLLLIMLAAITAITFVTVIAGCRDDPATNGQGFSIMNGTKSYNDAVAYITIVPPSGYGKFCSGVFVSGTLVLTARHCVEGQNPYYITACSVDDRTQVDDAIVSPPECNAIYQIHLPTSNIWPYHANVTPDFAVLELFPADSHQGAVMKISSTLPNPTNISTFQNKPVDVYGFSHNIDNGNSTTNQGNTHRLTGRMKMSGGSSDFNGKPSFSLFEDPQLHQYVMGGDCGGPVTLNGEVVGILVGHTASTPVVDHAAYIVPALVSSLIAASDSDQDGVHNSVDNCPQVPNADQANCNANDEPITPVGDACDPTPCLYLSGASGEDKKQANGYLVNFAAAIHYRGVGYGAATQPYPHLLKNVDAFFCACQNPSTSPPTVTMQQDLFCQTNTCDTDADPTAGNPVLDTGWRRMIWSAPDDAPGASGSSSCPLVDADGLNPPYPNDCQSPVPNRLFRKPYSDASSLGPHKGDWNNYWTDPAHQRTRWFGWDWRKEDFPHVATVPYTVEAGEAKVRLWVRPEGYAPANAVHPNTNHFTKPLSFVYYLKTLLPEALRLPKPWERWSYLGRHVLDDEVPGRWPGHLLVLPLSLERCAPELEGLFWNPLPPNAANKGLVIRRYNSTSGSFSEDLPSEVDFGSPVFTKDFAATADPRSGTLYVFGGHDSTGEYPPIMWRADPVEGPDGTRYHWIQMDIPDMPPGRVNAVLVFDQRANRLLLMFGETPAGTTDEVLSLDLETNTWSTLATSFSDIGIARAMAHSTDGRRLYLYGGVMGQEVRAGLFTVDLDTLSGWKVDGPVGPGPRYNAALHFDQATSTVYLFGGHDGEARRADLWRFQASTATWEQLADEDTPGAPQRTERGVALPSDVSGRLGVVPGLTDSGAAQPMWMFKGGMWFSSDDLKTPVE